MKQLEIEKYNKHKEKAKFRATNVFPTANELIRT